MSQPQKLRVIKNTPSQKPEVIRPELNLEQWLLWQPSNGRDAAGKPIFEAKVLEKEMDLPDGTRVTARVTADFTSFGALTTEDQKTLYGLVKIWEEKGEQYFNQTSFSIAQLLKVLKRARGGKSVPSLIKSLRRLRSNPIHLEHSFLDAETGTRVTTIEDPVTILSELKIIRREKNGVPVRDAGYFKFHPLILKNLAANYRKPVLIDVVLSLKSDVAQLIYSYIDRQLTFESKHRIKSQNLFREIGLDRDAYRYASKRKQTLDRALTELTGKPLSSGGIIERAELEPTKDKKDFNAVFKKGTHVYALPEAKKDEREDELTRRLLEELHIKKDQALMCSEHHRDFAHEILAAKEFFPDWQKKTGGFWLKAIVERYELPPTYIAKREQIAAEKICDEQKTKAISCPFCKDSYAPGMRRVITDKYPQGAMRQCTHDPVIEVKYKADGIG